MVSHKMTRKGFTLVELIVVITILAILATIAFLSFQGYSASARDSKRQADLASVNTKIRVLGINGTPMLSFVSGSGARFSWASYAGSGAIAGTDYEAGNLNYTSLGLKDSDYQDPLTSTPYKIGVTSKAGEFYEVAAVLEKDGTKENLLVGTYKARNDDTITGSAYDGTAKTITLKNEDLGKFRRGDTLATVGVITKVSADGKTLTVTTAPTEATAKLAAKESDGLIVSKTSTVAVKNGVVPATDLAY